MKMYSKTLLVAAITMSGSAMAATQGNLGPDSTGTSDVTIIKEDAVQISNVDDLDLGTMNLASADITATDEVCVFNTTATYSVTVSSSNGVFELRDGAEAIPYAVSWADDDLVPAGVVYGVAETAQLGDNLDPTCGAGTNASFGITITQADFNNAAAGTYTDTLTLLINPE